jgi:chromosome segregation ATPase
VSAEREHAAAVRSSEEESLRRVREKQKTARKDTETDTARRNLRRAKDAVEKIEAEIGALEARVADLTHALEDPELYTRSGGVSSARKQGVELEQTKAKLDDVLARWASATDEVERLAADPVRRA